MKVEVIFLASFLGTFAALVLMVQVLAIGLVNDVLGFLTMANIIILAWLGLMLKEKQYE